MGTLKPMTPLRPLIQASMKPPSPLLAPNKGALKPASPLHPKSAPKTPISRPQRRRRFQLRLGRRPQRRWRFQLGLGRRPQRRRWFQPLQMPASKGDTGFRRAGRLVYRTQMRYPWPVAGPGRATRGRPTLQTSSNHHDLNRLTKTPVTNVVNPSPKTTIISEKALRLTTFVTTRPQPHSSDTAPPVWREPEGPEGQTAVPMGGGRAWPGDQWAADVTNVVKPTRFTSPREDLCDKRRQSKPKNQHFHRKSRWIDDVCNNGAEIHTKNTLD